MFYYLLAPAGWLICKIMFRLSSAGKENIPAGNRFIIAANHTSFIDPVVIGAAIPRRIRWVIRKDVYYVWWLRWLFVLTGMIPENGAVGRSLEAVEKGRTVGLFPEGGRSFDGKIQKVSRKGIAVLALRSGAPVLPVVLKGAFEAFPRSAALPRMKPIRVVIGKPVSFPKDADPDEAAAENALGQIMGALRSLAEEN